MSVLCGIIARRRHKKVIDEIELARSIGLGMVEIRLDSLARSPSFKDLLRHRPCPIIATIRREVDGGAYKNSEDRRLGILRQAIAEGVDYVDVEMDVASSIRRFGSTKRIISYHNYESVPEALNDLYDDMLRHDPDVLKIACMANSVLDNFKMLDLVRNAKVPTVAFCMGELGFPSRVLAAKFGAPFTFARMSDSGRVVAPGLRSVDEFRSIYRIESIRRETPVFGVIGDPIAHSLSPVIHNQAMQELNFDGVYLPFRVARNELGEFLRRAEEYEIGGLSVTIPHKQAVFSYGRPGDDLVHISSSANTMVRAGSNWHLFNTDGPAAVEAIKRRLIEMGKVENPDRPFENRKVLILGSGGAARTIMASLKRENAILVVAARRNEQSSKLAVDLGCRAADWAQRHSELCDVVINTTPIGMAPDLEESPYHQGAIKEGMIIFDAVYTPERTELIRRATERGATVVTGVEMFAGQASRQFELFTNRRPTAGYVETLIREELSPAKKMLREARLGQTNRSHAGTKHNVSDSSSTATEASVLPETISSGLNRS